MKSNWTKIVAASLLGSFLLSSLTASAAQPPSICSAPPLGLVGWWRAEGTSANEVDGSNGLLVGNATYGAGKVGQGFVLDGGNDLVSVGNPPSLQLQNLTIEMWFKRGSASVVSYGSGGNGVLFGYPAGGYLLFMDSSGRPNFTQMGSWGATPTMTITDTLFHHLAVTKNEGVVTFYVDGMASAPVVFNPTFTFTWFAAIGGRSDNLDNSFFGTIDELAVYNRALSDLEVQAIFNAGGLGKCTGNVAPAIYGQPASQTASANDNVIFSVTAGGSPPLAYQWRFNATNIPGATAATLALPGVQAIQAGAYSVQVSNAFGFTLSSNAVLTVNPARSCVPLIPGLVSCWRAEGDAQDYTGGNNGTLVGSTGFALGEVGSGFIFDGNQDLVTVGNAANLQLQYFTIEAWIQRSSASLVSYDGSGNAVIFGFGNGGYSFWMDSSGRLAFSKMGGYGMVLGPTVADTGFHHVAVANGPSSLVFYLDGIPYANSAYGSTFGFSTPAAIGARADNFGNSFAGIIDELAVYDRQLTADEIQTIFNAGSSGKCYATAPVILAQPADLTVSAGDNAMLGVRAGGQPPLGYQWRFNGTNLPGATGTSLKFLTVQPTQGGNYSVLVTNPVGSNVSANALLTVNPALPCATPPTGLVSWWRGEGNGLDQAGGNNGTAVGNTAFELARVGLGFVLDGSGDYLNLGNPPSLQLQNLTIELWLKRANPAIVSLGSGGNGVLFGYGNGGYCFFMDSGGNLSFTALGGPNVSVSTQITDTNYHHVAVTKSGATIVFYVDGISFGAAPFGASFSFTASAAIGARADNADNGFLGIIDEVAVYNRPLASEEIQAIYNAKGSGKCLGDTPPAIYVQPTNQTVAANDNVTLAVIAGGKSPLSYQWRQNDTNIPGATTNSLTMYRVKAAQAGDYSVAITNSVGSITSSSALLVVNPGPACSTPAAGIVSWWRAEDDARDWCSGNDGTILGNTTFGPGRSGRGFVFDGAGDSIRVGNAANLQVQEVTIEAWIKRSSATTISFDGGSGVIFGFGVGGYCFYMNSQGRLAFSNLGSGIENLGPTVADVNFHHVAVSKSAGALVFYIDGISTALPGYSPGFQFNTVATIGSLSDGSGCTFFGIIDELAVYTRALSGSEIQAIYLAGGTGKCTDFGPLIYAQPQSQAAAVGDYVSFGVGAGGPPPLSYQWRYNGTNIAGATSNTLSMQRVQLAQAGNYSAVVSNAFGSVASSNATLTVNPGPPCVSAPGGLVGWWSGENDAQDQLSTNHGTLLGNATLGPGRVGRGFVFDGSGDLVLLGSSGGLQLQDFSIELWMKRASASTVSYGNGGAGVLFGFGTGGYSFYMDSSARLVLSKLGAGAVTLSSAITDTNFHHVAVTKASSSVTFFIDGAAYPTMTYSDTFTFGASAAIGARADNFDNSFLGTLDEVSVYDHALTPAQVLAIYNAAGSGKCMAGPIILAQPVSQTNTAGDTVTFSVRVGGPTPYGYQWRLNATNLPGATNSSLTLLNVQAAQEGNYSVQITNPVGLTLSSNAYLAVNPTPPCQPPPAGMVSWWRGESNLLDSAADNAGTFIGNATFGPGRSGQGFVFDGSGDMVSVGNPANLQLQDLTIELWIQRASTSVVSYGSGGNGILFGYGSGGYSFYMDAGGHLTFSRMGVASVTATTSIVDTNFHHVAVTKSSGSVVFYLDGVASSSASFGSTFSFTTPAALGARADNSDNGFFGKLDELAIYNRALSGPEIQALYNSGSAGKCSANLAPFIVAQPANQTVSLGSSATLTVAVGGNRPLSYQWQRAGTNLIGATNSSLAITNVQFTDSGPYSVLVSNSWGSIGSSNSVLSVIYPVAHASIPSPNVASGDMLTVPVVLAANGNENTLAFSLSFDTTKLTYASVSLGDGAPGGYLLPNASIINSGKLGAAVALPPGVTFSPGAQPVAQVRFLVSVLTNASTTTISFGDQPTPRQLLDTQLNALGCNFSNGTVSISAATNFEGDIFPRPGGDRSVGIADWLMLGRYVARLDYPTNASEFQRADVAPRLGSGDGAIRIGDWVQVGRYAAGLDPLAPNGGPTNEMLVTGAGPSPLRLASVDGVSLLQGELKTIPVRLAAQGNENASSFSLSFDPSLASFAGATLGDDATAATLYANTNLSSAGKVGFAIALPTGASLATGPRELLRVNFRGSTTNFGSFLISFVDTPVPSAVADATAIELPTSFVSASGTILPPRPYLSIAPADQGIVLSWPLWASNFVLQVNPDPVAPTLTWTNWQVTPILTNGQHVIGLPLDLPMQFYRLYSPSP